MSAVTRIEGRPRPVLIGAAMAVMVAMAVASCGEAASEAEVTRLDTDEVVSLSSELAICVGDGLGVEVAEDFLLEPDGPAFDLSQATPEQEQAVAECFSRVTGAPASSGADSPVLEVDVASDQ